MLSWPLENYIGIAFALAIAYCAYRALEVPHD